MLAAILLLTARGGKELKGWGEPSVGMNQFLEKHRGLAVWVVFYVVCIILFLIYGLTNGVEFHKAAGTWLLLGFVPLFAPLIVVAEYQRYKRLGKQSEHRPN